MNAAAGASAISLDHLVVACRTLEAGAAWCEATFGVVPSPGGRHPLMGTHNLLLAIGSGRFPKAYLELIAIDPGAPAPAQRRWFDLDDEALQATIGEPRLVHWGASCDDIEASAAAWRGAGCDPGSVVAGERMTARGLLRWRLTIRADGRRLADGALPFLIEWGEVHPTDSLSASGVTLQSVQVGAAAGAIGSGLGDVQIGSSGAPLQATLSSPRGRVSLVAPVAALRPGD